MKQIQTLIKTKLEKGGKKRKENMKQRGGHGK